MKPRALKHIGAHAAENIRRILLRQLSRPSVNRLTPNTQVPTTTLYSLAADSKISPGRYEEDLNNVTPVLHAFPIRPIVTVAELLLLHRLGKSLHGRTFTRNGLTMLHPVVRDGASDLQHIFTHCEPLVFNCKVARIRRETEINRFPVAVFCPDSIIGTAVKVRVGLIEQGQRHLSVKAVPEQIESAVPLIRRRENGPSVDSLAHFAAWSDEKKMLARVAGEDVSPQDIQVIGVFRRIPLSSAARIEIGPGPGNLSLYLRPNLGKVVQSACRPMFTIAFGRIRGKNNIVRALIPE